MKQFDKYERKGAYHWDEFSHKTPYRRSVIKITNWIGPGSTLDIGAGDGVITYMLNATGVDNDPLAVQLAQKHGANVILGNAYNLPFNDNVFSNVLMADSIEHLQYSKRALNEAKRVLQIGGLLYIVTPPFRGKIEKYHYTQYSPTGLKQLVENVGFEQTGTIEKVNDTKVRLYAKFKG